MGKAIKLKNTKTGEMMYPVTGSDLVLDPKTKISVKKDISELKEVLCDKEYLPSEYSGIGRINLKKNIVDSVNILEQSMMSQGSSIYIIQYDYDLNGKDIIVPENSVLYFRGGSLSNGSLKFDNTNIIREGNGYIFNNLSISGTITGEFLISYINTSKSKVYNAEILQDVTKAVFEGNGSIIWDVPLIEMETFEGFSGITLQNGVNDFNNTVFDITNKTEKCNLFKKSNTFTALSATSITNAVSNEVFKNTTGILKIKDENYFAERTGYDMVYDRNDILLVQDNTLMYDAIATYDDGESAPIFSYIIPDHYITIKNIKVIRNAESTYKTSFCVITGEIDLWLDNITIDTNNENNLLADEMFYIVNCFNVKLSNIKIRGSYSSETEYGYVFSFGNISKLTIDNMVCSSPWGIFGCNNINGVVIRDSIINRWDTHCYSKNFLFENCRFYNLYTQYSYHVGYIHYRNCEFNYYRPFLNDNSFNINKKVDLILECCTLRNCTKLVSNYLQVDESISRRSLISNDELPNLYVKRCIFDNSDDEYLYPFNNFTVIPSGRGTIKFEDCIFTKKRNVIQFSETTTNIDVFFNNVDLNPSYQTERYQINRSIRFKSLNARVYILNSKFAFYNGVGEEENDVKAYIKDSIVYSSRFRDLNLDKRYTFDRCTIILDCLDESAIKNYPPHSVYNECHFALPDNKTSVNLGWFQRGAIYNRCTFDENVTIGDKDIVNISKYLELQLPYVEVVRTIDESTYNEIISSGIGGTYKCWVSNVGFKYVIEGVEVTKEVYYN